MMETRIRDAFPGDKHKDLRVALYEIVWAYESLEDQEYFVGPIFNRIIQSGMTPEFWRSDDLDSLRNILHNSVTTLRQAAQRIETSLRTIEMLQLDDEAARRNGP